MESKEKTVKAETEAVKIKVLIPFRDKTNKDVIFEVGSELDFDKERASDVVQRKLADYVLPEG